MSPRFHKASYGLFAILSCSSALFADGQMNVSICNLGGLTESKVSRAKAEVEVVFRPVNVHIEWRSCDDYRAGAFSFLIRLRNDKPPVTRTADSLGVMGHAYLAESGDDYRADAYLEAIEKLAARNDAAPDDLLGFVIAHELGHLLLGEGHAPGGVMQAEWGRAAVKAVEQRRLQFNPAQRVRIRQRLQSRPGLQLASAR
jgi:hypothetical protein